MYGVDRYPAKYRDLTPEEIRKVEDIKNFASKFADMLEHTLPNTREASMAATKLDELVMWATKAITR